MVKINDMRYQFRRRDIHRTADENVHPIKSVILEQLLNKVFSHGARSA